MLGLTTGTWTHKTYHGPDSRLGSKATTLLPIVYSAFARGDYTRMALFPGTPEMDSRSCPEIVPVGVPGLWDFIAPRSDLQSGRGLNQSCSPRRELSNTMSHSRSARWEQVDSGLLVVGSQTANLTPDPSFAHNLSYKCPNDQCEAIFDIYVSRPFQ